MTSKQAAWIRAFLLVYGISADLPIDAAQDVAEMLLFINHHERP